jgi:gamma-glutamyltranspeptidase/glutathione hydrolase
MKFKRIAGIGLSGLALAMALAIAVYHFTTKDPTAIRLDPKIYDDYAGYYVLPNGYPVTIRREGDRLFSSAPERAPTELFPKTETEFFIRGNRARWIFHRDDRGQVDYAIARLRNFEERAEKRSSLPGNPSGTNGLIAVTTAGTALHAGLEVLKAGGSAADAAIAAAFCEVVQAGGSYVSFAGPLLMLYYDAANGSVAYLNAEYATPLEEKDPRSIPRRGGRTALVPGFMAGVQAAHHRFGKLPWKRLLRPAIVLAENGEVVGPVMEWWINHKQDALSRYPETKKIFTRPDGRFLVQGDVFRQPALAATLKQVAEHGAAYIYDGEWGRKFVEVIQREGGKISLADLKRYRATWPEPRQTTYHADTVYTPTSWGGVNMIEALNLMELANLKRHGPYVTSARSLFWLMQISACQSLMRNVPEATRTTKKNAALIWQQMQAGTWRGLPAAVQKRAHTTAHTDGLVIVDQWGNLAVLNHTINSRLWGDTGLFVEGVSIPDSASFQSDEMAKAGPGNRLPIGMCPLIVCREGKPILGSAATGGGLHAKTLQIMANILDFGMDPQTAADMPAFVGWGAGQVEAGSFDPGVLAALEDLGLKPTVMSAQETSTLRGYWVGAQINPVTRELKGGVTRGVDGGVAAY